MNHNDQQNMGRTCHDQHPHLEHIQNNQPDLKRGLLLAGLSVRCVKSYREIENDIIK